MISGDTGTPKDVPVSFFLYEISNATTTTAASGGNREELLGQRPARCECRPRHDADAGCRNPEDAEAIQNRPALRFLNVFILLPLHPGVERGMLIE